MGRPAFKVTVNRKDGEMITFKDYKGETVTKKFCPVGALFESRNGNGFNLVLERKVTLDPETLWISVFPTEDREEGERPAKKSATKKRETAPAKPVADESDDELIF